MGQRKEQVIGRWWNGQWRTARLDIWLIEDDGAYLVIGREQQEMDGQIQMLFTGEDRARRFVDRMMAEASGDWRDLTGITDALPL